MPWEIAEGVIMSVNYGRHIDLIRTKFIVSSERFESSEWEQRYQDISHRNRSSWADIRQGSCWTSVRWLRESGRVEDTIPSTHKTIPNAFYYWSIWIQEPCYRKRFPPRGGGGNAARTPIVYVPGQSCYWTNEYHANWTIGIHERTFLESPVSRCSWDIRMVFRWSEDVLLEI